MSKAKDTMLFVEKKAASKMSAKDRMVLAAKKGGLEGKEQMQIMTQMILSILLNTWMFFRPTKRKC